MDGCMHALQKAGSHGLYKRTHQDQVQGTHCHHQSARLRRQLRAKDRDARWPENSRPNQSPLAKLGLIPVRWTIRPLLELDLTTRRRNRAESCCPPASSLWTRKQKN